MKLFLILILLPIMSWAKPKCLQDAGADYRELYSSDAREELLLVELKMTKGLTLNLLTSKSTCGAKRCEYAGYTEVSKGCLMRVIDFYGTFLLGTPRANEDQPLIVQQTFENYRQTSCEWFYDSKDQIFKVDVESCKTTTKPI